MYIFVSSLQLSINQGENFHFEAEPYDADIAAEVYLQKDRHLYCGLRVEIEGEAGLKGQYGRLTGGSH